MTIEQLFPRWVLTDEDVAFQEDMAYMQSIADGLVGTAPVKVCAWPLIERDVKATREPWFEYDPAGELIKNWRAEK